MTLVSRLTTLGVFGTGRVLAQGDSVRALEFTLGQSTTTLAKARELSIAADGREVLIDTDRPTCLQVLMDSAPVPRCVPRSAPRSKVVVPSHACGRVIRICFELFEGITVYEATAHPTHMTLHVKGVRKLYVNRTHQAFGDDIESAEVRSDGTLVITCAHPYANRKCPDSPDTKCSKRKRVTPA